MNDVQEVLSEFIFVLSSAETLSEYKITRSFPPELKQSPLKRSVLSCGIEKAKIERESTGVQLTVTVLTEVHIPVKNGGEESAASFDKISQAVLSSSAFEVKSAECGKLSYRRETDSLVMPVKTTLVSFKENTEPVHPPKTAVLLYVDGEVTAAAELCKARSFRVGELTSGERENFAFGMALGVINYRLELSDFVFADERVDFYALSNFNLVLIKSGKKITYGGCNWLEIEEDKAAVKKAVVLSQSRICEEA